MLSKDADKVTRRGGVRHKMKYSAGKSGGPRTATFKGVFTWSKLLCSESVPKLSADHPRKKTKNGAC